MALDRLVQDVCEQIVLFLGFPELSSLTATSSTWLECVSRSSPLYLEQMRKKYPMRLRTVVVSRPGEELEGRDWRRHLIEAHECNVHPRETNCNFAPRAPARLWGYSSINSLFSSKLAFLSRFFRGEKKKKRILIVGLDDAGKTTLLYKLKSNHVDATTPTVGFTVETADLNEVELMAWDVGGSLKIRPLWRHYYPNTVGIVFVVDSTDRDRLGDGPHGYVCNFAVSEFKKMVEEDDLKNLPVLVMANKQDERGAMTTDEIATKLGVKTWRNQLWCVQGCCATSGEGLYQGFEWLSQAINK